ncbi:unnamed protein product, partial [Effrenium voratum]
ALNNFMMSEMLRQSMVPHRERRWSSSGSAPAPATYTTREVRQQPLSQAIAQPATSLATEESFVRMPPGGRPLPMPITPPLASQMPCPRISGQLFFEL